MSAALLGDHGADAGPVAAGVGDQVLAGGLQLFAAVGELAADGTELASRLA